ncbi:uncharacterized protein TRAVEDRAFT_58302 [Trametes versicolor FP-101664 SS1]|uniref:uncharacterized protein n=1 Tax=Trametes versicolor (strain FP-101664) TaxID=717944 RepID=UPI0004624514|nr:uncharacterized protein TRAVEDRAFT_58302 [Trametes versicolor FP-101664 SS1]EIW59498.1 hypothetical protein TRAVEDRAFT_58302 [Trametes versicolor FP-101664 SS1]
MRVTTEAQNDRPQMWQACNAAARSPAGGWLYARRRDVDVLEHRRPPQHIQQPRLLDSVLQDDVEFPKGR